MNLDIVESCEHDEDDKIWLKLGIYHRMNETLFVSKSLFWRRWHHDNNVASLLKLLEIAAASSVLYFIGQSEFQCQKSQKFIHFSFDYAHGRGIKLCQSNFDTYHRNAKDYFHFGISIAIGTFWGLSRHLWTLRMSKLDVNL